MQTQNRDDAAGIWTTILPMSHISRKYFEKINTQSPKKYKTTKAEKWLSSESKEGKWRYLSINDHQKCLESIQCFHVLSKVQCESKTIPMKAWTFSALSSTIRLKSPAYPGVKRAFEAPFKRDYVRAMEKSGKGWWIEFLNTAEIHFLSVCLFIFCQLIDDESRLWQSLALFSSKPQAHINT